MRNKIMIIATSAILLAGGAFYAVSSGNCPLAGTSDCPITKECPLAGTPECAQMADNGTISECCKR